MPDILQEFDKSASEMDLWASWDQELRLRKQLRSAPEAAEGLKLGTVSELDFLRRSLYFSPHRHKYWAFLYHNRDSLIVTDYLRRSPELAASEFFPYLAELITLQKLPGRDLQFLINMYGEEFKPAYRILVNRMDARQCSYLESRTTNPDLRQLLQERLDQLASQSVPRTPAGIAPTVPAKSCPCLYGDKLGLIALAIEAVNYAQNSHEAAPWQINSLEAILQSAELLFQAGLITDCLSIVADLLNQAENQVVSHVLNPDGVLHKPVHQLLRQTIPIYSLLAEPTNPHGYALALYRSHYPGFKPDPGSLIYLDINSITASGFYGFHQYLDLELTQKAAGLSKYRPDDLLAPVLLNWNKSDHQISLEVLQQIVTERFSALPHEAFTAMGLICLAHKEQKIALDRTAGTMLLQEYMLQFSWIPSKHFMNEELFRAIGPLADEPSCRAAQAAISAMEDNGRLDNHFPEQSQRRYEEGSANLPPKWPLLGKYGGVY